MLKMLRADFYKIVKSKTLLILLIVALCTTLVNPLFLIGDYIANKGIKDTYLTVYGILIGQTGIVGLMWIFVIPFVCKDFSSNYIKNVLPVYTQKDKIYYILSKILYIFIFCIIYSVLNFSIQAFFNYAFGPGVMFNPNHDTFTVKQFWIRYIAEPINAVAVGSFILFLGMLLKKEYFVLVIIIPYLFLISSLIYTTIDEAVLEETGKIFQIEVYTVFGPLSALSYSTIENSELIIGLSVLYTTIFSVLSWLVFRKRSY